MNWCELQAELLKFQAFTVAVPAVVFPVLSKFHKIMINDRGGSRGVRRALEHPSDLGNKFFWGLRPILLQFYLLSFKSFIISFTENYAHLPKLLYPLQCPVSQLFNVVISVHALKSIGSKSLIG